MKLIPGLSFLVLLVFSPTPLFNQQGSFHFLKRVPNWVFSVLAGIVITLVGLLVRKFVAGRDQGDIKATLSELFKDRINFTRILSLLCFIFFGGIALRLPYIDESQPGYSRAELACLVYMIYIVLCALMEGIELFRPKRGPKQQVETVHSDGDDRIVST
jgi:hypothetical protein